MLIEMKCPNCGASLDFDNTKEFVFCSHCGTKIANIDENINVNHSGEVTLKRDKSEDPNLIISYATIQPLVCLSTIIKPIKEQWIYSQNQNKSYRLAPGKYVIVFGIGRRRWSKTVYIPNDNTPVSIQVVFNNRTVINIQQPPQGIQDYNNALAAAREQALAQCVAAKAATPSPRTDQDTTVTPPVHSQPSQKTRKLIFKRWWFWVFIAPLGLLVSFIFLIVVLSASLASSAPEGSVSSSNVSQIVEKTDPSSDDSSLTESSSVSSNAMTPEQKRQEYIDGCRTIDYATLARNPDKYKGEHFKFTGQVIQVLESSSWFDDSTTLRVNVTPEENQFADGGYLWSDTIVCTVTIPKGEGRILEDDIIDLYGECYGLYTYKAVLGNEISIPRIDIEYYTSHE